MWQVFKNSSLSSLRLSWTPFNPKLIFLQNSINFKFKFAKSLQGMHFWYPLLSFYWVYADFSLGFYILGIFRKWVGVLSFCEIFSKSLIELSPIYCDCSCVGPLWQFEHLLRQNSLCSCILHYPCTLLHVRCLTKCPSDIFVLNWTQVSSNAWILSCLIMLIMFWSVFVVFTHYVKFVPQCHAMHTLSTPHASHAASLCITCCTHMH